MDEKCSYKCMNCGMEKSVNGPDESIPVCCGEPMAVCTVSETAEHVRFDEKNEPCDDGRAGNT